MEMRFVPFITFKLYTFYSAHVTRASQRKQRRIHQKTHMHSELIYSYCCSTFPVSIIIVIIICSDTNVYSRERDELTMAEKVQIFLSKTSQSKLLNKVSSLEKMPRLTLRNNNKISQSRLEFLLTQNPRILRIPCQ